MHWVFNQDQLEKALVQYNAERNAQTHGACHSERVLEEAQAVRNFLQSKQACDLGLLKEATPKEIHNEPPK